MAEPQPDMLIQVREATNQRILFFTARLEPDESPLNG